MGRPKGALGKNNKKKGKDVNKPKRSTSAYFFFLAHCRQEAAKEGKPPTKIAEFTKECSAKWRALNTDRKVPFEAAAAEDKKRYEREMAIFKGKTVDPNKPKRPPTAYFIFLADFRKRMATANIEHRELLKKAGEDWRNLSTDLKRPYEKKALEESKKYEQAMTEYRRTGGAAAHQAAQAQLVAQHQQQQQQQAQDDDDEDDDEEDDDEDDEDDDDE